MSSEETTSTAPPDTYFLQDWEKCGAALKDKRYRDKRRTLVFCSRGIGRSYRHLMLDIRRMLPHSKAEVKWGRGATLSDINELCELHRASSCLYFESRKLTDLYLWMSITPNGPSAKFQILNVSTLAELHFGGNCLVSSRPLLIFDQSFNELPMLQLYKEMFTQVFSVALYHPKSQPFFDHAMCFFYHDNKIFFRHYQIAPMISEKDANKVERQVLKEIGPRFVLDPIKILEGSFNGPTLFENSLYRTPTSIRVAASKLAKEKRRQSQDSGASETGSTPKPPPPREVLDGWARLSENAVRLAQ